MKFVGYTYKADVEEQRNLVVKVLTDLGHIEEEQIQEQQRRLSADQNTPPNNQN